MITVFLSPKKMRLACSKILAAIELIFLTINLAKRKYTGNKVVGGGQESQSPLHPQICKQQHHPEPRVETIKLWKAEMMANGDKCTYNRVQSIKQKISDRIVCLKELFLKRVFLQHSFNYQHWWTTIWQRLQFLLIDISPCIPLGKPQPHWVLCTMTKSLLLLEGCGNTLEWWWLWWYLL